MPCLAPVVPASARAREVGIRSITEEERGPRRRDGTPTWIEVLRRSSAIAGASYSRKLRFGLRYTKPKRSSGQPEAAPRGGAQPLNSARYESPHPRPGPGFVVESLLYTFNRMARSHRGGSVAGIRRLRRESSPSAGNPSP